MSVVLVVGLAEGSGKTVLAASLVAALRREGTDAVGVKPLSGLDLWASPWILGEWEERRVLVGPDMLVHERASEGAEPVELLAPVVLVWAPRDPSLAGWRQARLGDVMEPVAGRITTCRGGRAQTLHFVDVEGLGRVPQGLASRVTGAAGRLIPLPLRAGRDLSSRVASGGYIGEADLCARLVASRHELVVVESQSDMAVPIPLGLEAVRVLVAGYGSVAIVDGRRWARAVEVVAGTGLYTATVREVLQLAGAEETVHLPFAEHPLEGVPREDLEPILAAITRR